MRIFYSVMTFLAAVGLFSSPAAAKTVTVHVDDPTHVVVMDPETYSPLEFDGNNVTVTTTRSSIQASSTTGWLIASATNDAGESVGYYTKFPTESASLDLDKVEDGGNINITTEAIAVKVYTVIGDPEIISVSYDYSTREAVDGKWVIEESSLHGKTIQITSLNDNYAITKVTDEAGKEYTPSYGTVYVSCYDINTSMTFTVHTINLAEARTATMTVNVDGDPAKFTMKRKDNSNVTLNSGSNTVAFDPENEVPFVLEHATYNKTIYSVEISNGGTVERQGSRYNVTPVNGSTLDIQVDYPDKDVNVSFTFANEGTEGALKGVRSSGSYVTATDGVYVVKLGSTLEVEFNKDDYDISGVTLNGSPITIPTYSPYTVTVTSEEPMNFVVTATQKLPTNITIVAENPEGLIVYRGYSYNDDRIELTGTTTKVVLPASVTGVTIKAAAGYKMSYIEVGSTTYQSGDLIPVSEGMEILCGAEEYVRDQPLTLYVGGTADVWNYRSLTLASDFYDLRKAYYDSELPLGYSVVMFNEGDLPLQIGGYPQPVVYLNGVECVGEYGRYSGLDNVKAGDVLKMFPATPESFDVTYTIAADAAASVFHDRTLAIDNPSTHTVLAGTEITIVPAENKGIAVKANGTAVDKNDDGKYVVTVNAATAVEISADSSGIDEIQAGEIDADAPVYNIQGIQVGTAADLDRLPAGLYIVGGKKIKI